MERIYDVKRLDELPPLTRVRVGGVAYLIAKPDKTGRRYGIRLNDGELVRLDWRLLVEVLHLPFPC